MKPIIWEDETVEDLQLGGLKLLQKKNGFRFGMDSVLLAHFAMIRSDDLVVDFGTGTGILPLLLIGRGKGKEYICFEIQESYCSMAERTMEMNGLEKRVRIFCEDAGNADKMIEGCSVDAVIFNPPYARPGSALVSPVIQRATARNQKDNMLMSFFTSAFRILKGKGKCSIVYPAAQMYEAMKMMEECHLQPKRFQLVYPDEEKAANLVLIEGVKDAKPMLHPMKPLIIYDRNRNLTNELKSIYHINEQNTV